jgi:hypothetical protein
MPSSAGMASESGRERVTERKRAAGASDVGVREKMFEPIVAPSNELVVGGTVSEMIELEGSASPSMPEKSEDRDSESTWSAAAESVF